MHQSTERQSYWERLNFDGCIDSGLDLWLCTYVAMCSSDLRITFLIGVVHYYGPAVCWIKIRWNIKWVQAIVDYMLTVHTHTYCFAEQPCQLAPSCCHTQDTAGMYTHIIMLGGVSGLHYAWSSGEARPVECEREAQERATLSDTCQRSHTTSP